MSGANGSIGRAAMMVVLVTIGCAPAHPPWVLSATRDIPGFDTARWRWSAGGPGTDWITRVRELSDGTVVATGYIDRDLPTARDWKAFAVRFTADGEVIWVRTFDGLGIDALWDVRETAAGHLAFAGFTAASPDAASNAWLLVLDRDGKTWLDRRFGDAGAQQAMSVVPTADGGYLFVGESTPVGTSERDVLAIRTDPAGRVRWERLFGGPEVDRAFFVERSGDSYVLSGVTGPANRYDLLTMRLDDDGHETWRRVVGGPGNDPNHGLNVLPDGRIVVTGYTASWDAREHDLMAVTYASDGTLLRHEVMGGPGDDRVMASATGRDGGTWLFGYTTSRPGGDWDVMLARLRPDGSFEPWIGTLGSRGPDFAYAGVVARDGELLVGGYWSDVNENVAPPDLLLFRIARERLTHGVEDVRVRRLAP